MAVVLLIGNRFWLLYNGSPLPLLLQFSTAIAITGKIRGEYPGDSALRLVNLDAAIKASKDLAENYRQWRAQLDQHNGNQTNEAH